MMKTIFALERLVKLSNHLDSIGAYSISDRIDCILKAAMPLSDTEREQLGQSAEGSKYKYINEEEWNILRPMLVDQKPSSSYVETEDFKYDPELTAYTPGETLELLSNPKVLEWFDKIKNYKIPNEYKHIILVPCAASKPWGASCPGSGKYYKAYHDIKKQLREEDKLAFWVTISEPLGIVPEDMWDSFPGYDVPGLFKNRSQQFGGIQSRDYAKLFGETRIPPFDKKAYRESIRILGNVIGSFIMNNSQPDRKWISFVKGTKGKVTTHTDMLRDALSFLEEKGLSINHSSHTKAVDEKGVRPTRENIYEHVYEILQDELV